jgi:hypothetical protein
MWVYRKNNNTDNIARTLLAWHYDDGCNKISPYFYNNVMYWSQSCNSGSQYAASAKNVWVHWSGTLVNNDGTSNDNYIVYMNGNQVASTVFPGPQPTWPEMSIFELGKQGLTPDARVFDVRFWYQKALTLSQVRRQMCYSGYYWSSGSCVACPSGTTSSASGAAYASECSCAAGSYMSDSLLQGLGAWYRFGTSSADILLDSSGRNKTLSNVNNVQFTSTDFKEGDGGVSFGGSNYFEVPHTGGFSPAQFTIVFWCKVVQKSGYQAIASTKEALYRGWLIYVKDNTFEFWTGSGSSYSGWETLVSGFATSPASWKHVAITMKQSTSQMSLYIDGVLFTTRPRTYVRSESGLLRIGAADLVPANYYLASGSRIDDFRFYERLLSDTEIFRIYNSSQPECRQCEAGTYQNSTSCISCPAGTYSGAGASACAKCPAGQFPPGSSGASTCNVCSAGKYLTNVSGGTDDRACTSVSFLRFFFTLILFNIIMLSNKMLIYS